MSQENMFGLKLRRKILRFIYYRGCKSGAKRRSILLKPQERYKDADRLMFRDVECVSAVYPKGHDDQISQGADYDT